MSGTSAYDRGQNQRLADDPASVPRRQGGTGYRHLRRWGAQTPSLVPELEGSPACLGRDRWPDTGQGGGEERGSSKRKSTLSSLVNTGRADKSYPIGKEVAQEEARQLVGHGGADHGGDDGRYRSADYGQ
jgi:hypothetical protein